MGYLAITTYANSRVRGVGANQQELTTYTNSGGQEKKKNPKKKGLSAPCPGVDPWSPAGRELTPGQGADNHFIFIFIFSF
jgi:hypothetical protein